MSFGAETNTRWLWFITYVLLPLNVIGQACVLFWFVDNGQGGMALVLILAELCLAIVTIVGLHQQKPWGWYCIMAMFGIQLVGTPLKVYVRASMRNEIVQSANSYLQSRGRALRDVAQPSLFDVEPMLTFFMLMMVWTIPNAVYIYRRRTLFAVNTLNPGFSQSFTRPPQIVYSNPANGAVTDIEEQAFADAQREFDGGTIREGLMIKVSTEEPEPHKQRLLYIHYRAQQLRLQRQRAIEKARKVAATFFILQVTKQLAIAALLFWLPLYASVADQIYGFVLWLLYALLLIMGRCSRLWLAVPATCLIGHLLSRFIPAMGGVFWLAAFVAIPYFITAVKRIMRSRTAIVSEYASAAAINPK